MECSSILAFIGLLALCFSGIGIFQYTVRAISHLEELIRLKDDMFLYLTDSGWCIKTGKAATSVDTISKLKQLEYQLAEVKVELVSLKKGKK